MRPPISAKYSEYISGIPGRSKQPVTYAIFFYYSFKYVMDDNKNDLHQFSDVFVNFSGSNGRNCRKFGPLSIFSKLKP